MSQSAKSTSRGKGFASPVKVHIDGAARGNPGPAGVGIVFADSHGRKLHEHSFSLGEATNNVSEQMALVLALQEALQRGYRNVLVFSDSELLVRQVTGEYRVKDKQLQRLQLLIQHLTGGFRQFEIHHTPREQNRQADRLANRAVTEGLRRSPRRPVSSKRASPPSGDPTQATFW